MTPTGTPTVAVTPIPGDVDGNLVPDAALIGSGSVAELVLGIDSTPTKVRFGGAALAADIGVAPGDVASSLITVVKAASSFEWRSTSVLTGGSRVFKTTSGLGVPVVGCYRESTYTAASYVPSRVTGTVRYYTASSDIVVKLPVGVMLARCGAPVNGTSALFSLVKNAKRKTLNVVARSGASQIFSSAVIDSKLSEKGMLLGTVPRGTGQHPTAMILAKKGKVPMLYVRDKGNKWQPITLPSAGAGTTPTGFTSVRVGTATFIVVQFANAAKDTSYKTVVVPAGYL
jgi:hypothetical protein